MPPSAPPAPLPAAPPVDAFTEALEAFFRSSRRARARDAVQSGEELSLPQYHLLELLIESPEATVGALAERAGVAPPTATRMLDALARSDYVERRPAEHDRRAVLITLTTTGRRALRSRHARVLAWRASLRDSLTPTEREQAAVLLRRMAEVIADL